MTPQQVATALSFHIRGSIVEVAISETLDEWDDVPLGQMPDVYIARSLGLSHTAVIYARQRRGIPSCSRRPHARDGLRREDADFAKGEGPSSSNSGPFDPDALSGDQATGEGDQKPPHHFI